jgi:ER membrane protein complex subunit 7
MRAEFEERQRNNPMNTILGSAQPGGQSPIGNFDMAAFLAGSNKKDGGNGNGGGGQGKAAGKR